MRGWALGHVVLAALLATAAIGAGAAEKLHGTVSPLRAARPSAAAAGALEPGAWEREEVLSAQRLRREVAALQAEVRRLQDAAAAGEAAPGKGNSVDEAVTRAQGFATPGHRRPVLRLFPPCALISHAQGSSGVVANMPFAWRGHAKRLTTRARPSPDLAVWLE